MSDPEVTSGWVVTSILAVISTLASTVAYLYKKMADSWKVREVELKEELRLFKEETNQELVILRANSEKCRQDHVAALLHSARLEQRIEDLERTKKDRESIG